MSQPRGTAEHPLPDDIRGQLERMLAQTPFNRSPVLSRFLGRGVERLLRPGAPPAKEYTIGLEVFDRPDDFDPRIDTIVRVEARRLRDALTNYYAHCGSHDRVRLEMPKGQYGICASLQDAAAEVEPEGAHDPAAQAPTFTAVSLPVPRTPLIGRDEEMDRLAHCLRIDKVRLLSITGVGGTGKTRLALALADQVRDAFPGGVLFLDLAPVTDRSTLIDRLVELFNIRQVDEQPVPEIIAEHLRRHLTSPILLVLDNLEGVREGADVLGELLDASDQVNLLVTSRLALCLYGEHEFPLAPLAVPSANWQQQTTDLAAVPSVQLFLTRAKAANPHVDLSGNPEALAELCVRLDGLPLAIELVAAQAGTLGPRQMLERFTGHLDLPENPARDAPSRQRTLRRTIDWSHDLLDEDARRLLRRLSVFVGGFTLEAIEGVADATADLGGKLIPSLHKLLAMGLIYSRTQAGEPRYAMLETLRAYGLERLAASTDTEMTRKAHAAYLLVLAEEGNGTLEVLQREQWLASCDREKDNFRQALEYLLSNGPGPWCLRLGQALFGYWERRELLTEGERQLQRIVDTVPVEADKMLWARVGAYAATMTALLGKRTEAHQRYQHLLELYRGMGDMRGEAMILSALAVCMRTFSDEASARDHFAQALELCRRMGDRSENAAALSNLANSERKLGNTKRAARLLIEARDLFIELRDPVPEAWCLNHLGDVARAEGEFAKADELYRQAEATFRQQADAWGLARTKADRGELALESSDPQQAWPLLLDALTRFDSLHHQRGLVRLAESLASYAQRSGQFQLSVKLLAAATTWRATLGFRQSSNEDRTAVQAMWRKACEAMDNDEFGASQQAGSHMNTTDVAEVVKTLAAGPPVRRRQ